MTATGAEAIIGTLADCGVAACFVNPGTSEMHLVTALDREPRIRSILCLFEGVATGADRSARIRRSKARSEASRAALRRAPMKPAAPVTSRDEAAVTGGGSW